MLQYRAEHPDFPHQSTLNQWFDESQFESYRKLGLCIGEQVVGKLDRDGAGWLAADKV